MAARAEVSSAAGEEDPADGGSAIAAWFAGAQVDAVLQLEESTRAVGVDIIGDRGAAQSDGMLQDAAEGPAQTLELGTGESTGRPAWTDAGMEEAFVGIDVAHSGEKRLVEKGGLDGELATAKESGEVVGCNQERFGAGRFERRDSGEFAELEAAEAAGIDKAEFAAARQGQPGVGVRGDQIVGGGDEQAAGHAEVDDPLRVCL